MTTSTCTPPGQPPGTMRASRRGRWRALSLVLVHVVFALHMLHWARNGATLSPVEPSEAGQTLGSQAIINAGFVFFAITILSTLIVGRFFCGWGCHIVALQDLCTWLLGKIGIRPRPLRSRLLVFVPLLAAVYMFALPTVTRLWLGLPRNPLSVRFVTEDFWTRFPGPVVAVLTFLICGFLVVYLLGNKGFCTYACPYGGIFGPVDQLAPGKIRVTDACDACGHCTANCTSNVRVHEEVKLHRMVVDPGCMKCLDCISVCPTEALYFGFGKPALAKGAPRAKPPQRRFDYTWPEEIALAGVFLVSMAILRGVYDRVPLLLGLGLASITAFMVLTAVRFLRGQRVRVGPVGLRTGGGVTRGAVVFGVLLTAWLALLAQAGAVRLMAFGGGQRVRDAAANPAALDAAALADGIRLLEGSVRFAAFSMPRWEGQLAAALAAAGRHDEAEAYYRRAVEHAPHYGAAWSELARYARARGDHAAAAAAIERLTELAPTDRNPLIWLELATERAAAGDDAAALAAATRATELEPATLDAQKLAAETALRLGHTDQAAGFVAISRELAPEDTHVIELWARYLKATDGLATAIAAAEAAPDSRRRRIELAFLYQAAGRYDDARRIATELAGTRDGSAGRR